MNGVQTGLKCKPNVKRCKRFVFAAHSPLLHPNTLTTKAISHFQADHILTRFVFPPLNGLTEIFKKENPKAAERPGFQNMFNNAPTVVFIANDPAYDMSQIDCGLLGENMILSAWSMGIGSCCLGGPVRFMKSPAAAEYMKQLGFSEGYELLYAIAFGYPDEMPAAKPREVSKVKFVD